MNWIVRLRERNTAVGALQAEVSDETAVLAWTIGYDAGTSVVSASANAPTDSRDATTRSSV